MSILVATVALLGFTTILFGTLRGIGKLVAAYDASKVEVDR